MWLRNKKTGRVCDAIVRERKNSDGTYSTIVCTIEKRRPGVVLAEYYSLAKLYEDWEDYKLSEPLIKDPKVRKAVRAWGEANNLMNNNLQIVPLKPSDGAYNDSGILCNGSALMSITLIHGIGRGLRDSRKSYTITELCGEDK